jgi:hypothetical protein
VKTGRRLLEAEENVRVSTAAEAEKTSTSARCLAVRFLTQRLRETTPTENLVGRDAIRRQPLHSAPLSLG